MCVCVCVCVCACTRAHACVLMSLQALLTLTRMDTIYIYIILDCGMLALMVTPFPCRVEQGLHANGLLNAAEPVCGSDWLKGIVESNQASAFVPNMPARHLRVKHNNNNVHLARPEGSHDNVNPNMIFCSVKQQQLQQLIFYTHVEHSPTKTIYMKYYNFLLKTLKNKNKIKCTTNTHTL